MSRLPLAEAGAGRTAGTSTDRALAGTEGVGAAAAGASTPPAPRLGERRQRRLERRRARRRRTVLFASLVAALGAALGGTVVAILPFGRARPAHSSSAQLARTGHRGGRAVAAAGESAGASNVATRSGSAGATSAPPVVALVDGAGVLAAALVLALGAPGRTSLVLALPGGLATEVPGLGPAPIAAAYATGGDRLLRAVVENLLGVPLGPLVVVGPAEVSRLLGAGGASVLAQGPGGEPLAVALGEELLAEARARPTALPAGLSRSAALAVLAELARRRTAVVSPEVEPVGSEALPAQSAPAQPGAAPALRVPLLAPARGALASLVRQAFPPQAGAAARRPRVQILNGTGALGLDAAVFERLVPAVRVEVTGNAPSFGHRHTEIVYYGDRPSAYAAAALVRRILGTGVLVASPQAVGVVSVTVLAGADLSGS
jgi:hypothetical protein